MIDRYADLRAALEAGPTPGPWSAYINGSTAQVDNTPSATGARPCIVSWSGFDGNDLSVSANRKNTRYIAAAHPEAIRALLAERDAKDAEIATLRRALRKSAAVLAGIEMNKSALVHALELARTALTQQEQGK